MAAYPLRRLIALADLYLDENTTVRLIEPLTALGHDVVSANDLGHKGRVDADQFLVSAEYGRVLLTSDRNDFRLLHEAWTAWSRAWGVSRSHAGIIVIHPAPNLPIKDVAWAVDAYLSRDTAPLENRLIGWKPPAGWYEVFTRT